MKNKTRLYHAIQLNELRSYVREGGILSRKKLASVNSHFTRFFTDAKDYELGCWDRTFGNFTDFGSSFYRNTKWSPNAYGPITLVMHGDTLDELQEVRLTRRTITRVSELSELLNFDDYPHYFDTSDIQKKLYYPLKNNNAMEFSCADDCIPWKHIKYVLVDPIEFCGVSLTDRVAALFQETGLETRIIERTTDCPESAHILSELINWADTLQGSLLHRSQNLKDTVPVSIKRWFDGLHDIAPRILASWLTYTYNGTLLHMKNLETVTKS